MILTFFMSVLLGYIITRDYLNKQDNKKYKIEKEQFLKKE